VERNRVSIVIPPLLFSFHYLQRGGAVASLCHRLMQQPGACLLIDSGAFSAHRLGERIRLTYYTEACRYYLDSPQVWGCIQLDVIGNAEGSRRNLMAMVDSGVRPMPVLTSDAPLERLQEYQQVNDRICIAGALGSFIGREEWINARYRQAHATVPTAQLHGLGYIRWPDMYSSGLTTCDSSTHSAGERYGLFGKFNRGTGIEYLTLPERKKGLQALDPKWLEFIRDCGASKAEINDEELFGRGAASFVAFAQSVATGLWSQYSAKHDMKVFLACSNWIAAARIMIGLRYALPDGRFDWPKARAEFRACQTKPKQRLDRLTETMEILRNEAVCNRDG